jgi:signal transduction histidine kinase
VNDREDWGAYRREMWRRRGARGPRRRPGLGFGCFFLLFGLIIGSLVATAAAIISNFGPVPAIVSAVVVAALVVGVASAFVRIGRTLDSMEEAAERVQEGDYAVRVRVPDRGLRPVRHLARGFNTMVERLQRDEDQRRTLLNDVSHELRTPLSVIAGNIEAMIDGVRPADEAHLSAILEETRVMERLIDDLRTLALAEAGALRLHREPLDVGALVGDVAAGFDARADETGVSLGVTVGEDLPAVEADAARIRQVVANLVVNAFEHTPRGGRIDLAASRDGDGVTVAVLDTGSGIDAELLPRIFDRFQRAADSPGSGLGLAIARDLVEAHGGQIHATSEPGAGTRVEFSLPARAPR